MRRPAFLLVEALIGIALFAILVVAAYGVLLHGQVASIRGGDRVRATEIANQALQAAKSIRAGSFSSVTVGTHGVAIGGNGQWTWSGSQITHSGGFITSVVVTSQASDWALLTATTRWNHGANGSGTVILSAELTDWKKSVGGNWASVSLEGNYTDAGTPLFNDVAISGNYAFVSSETSAGGAGLYVFDISNLLSPSRVASAFSIGGAAYDLALNGNVLYVLTDDVNGELKAYSIASPSTLSAEDSITSYNLPGSGLGSSMAIDGDTLYVGAIESNAASRDEFYVFDVTNTGSIILSDSLNDPGSVGDIAIRGTTAYLGSAQDTSEVRVVDITTPSNISFLGGYNLTDVHDGITVIAFGTGTVIGRTDGAAISELTRFAAGAGGVPSAPPGPWYREMGGNVNAGDIESSECAGFFATSNSTKELQVVNVRDTALTEFTSYNTTTGDGRGIRYDATLDRVFMVTNKAILIIKPASGTLTCS